MTDTLFSTADYTNWLNATNGYDIYDTNGSYGTYNYDEAFFTTVFNDTAPTNSSTFTLLLPRSEMEIHSFILPWWRQVIWSLLFGVMVIVATGGNLIVIWIVLAHKRMRTVTNYFIVNLSIADAMVSSLNVTFNYVYMLNSHWPFGLLYCKVSQFISTLSIFASVFTLMAIAIDRYMAIMSPLRPRMGKRATLCIAGFIWVIGVLMSSPNLLFQTTYTHVLPNGANRVVCYPEWPDGQTNHSYMEYVYNVVYMFLTYFLPIGSMSFTYARVGIELWGSQSIGECTQRQLDNIKSKRRVVKMMMVVVLIFAVCWLPFHLYFIIISYDPSITMLPSIQEIYLAIYWLAMSNSMYNPIIYCWMNQRFRRGFKQFFRWCPFVHLAPEVLQRRDVVTSRYSCSGSPDHNRIIRNDTERSFLYTCPGSPTHHHHHRMSQSGSVRIPMHLTTGHNQSINHQSFNACNTYITGSGGRGGGDGGIKTNGSDHPLIRTSHQASQKWTTNKSLS